jgi:two-component system, OmpR family, KDP operon response regulator KdpE
MNHSVLIVDDEPQLRNLLKMTLQLEGYKVFEASTGAEGIESAAKNSPDLILLDLGLPDRSGHDILKHLRDWFSRPIIIISAQHTLEDIIKALDNGANDYIGKPFQNEELLARIRAAIRNHSKERNVPKAQFAEVTIDFVTRTVKKNDHVIKLTATEYQLLCVFLQNEGKVLTHRSLLTQVWGPGNQNDLQYIRVFMGNLRKKLEDDPNKPVHFITESGVGYRYVGNIPESH